jgi:carbon storage regulator
MLILRRKVDERIRIGDDIEVIVLSVEGDHVKLGIQAPRQITVLRYELLEGVREENRRAAAAAASAPLGPVLQGITQLGKPTS